MSDPSLQVRARHIRFSSTVSESFAIQRVLSKELFQSAQDYWKNKGLAIKSAQMADESSSGGGQVSAEFVAEGGTIWTTNFDSYKKTVTVSMLHGGQNTEVSVLMVLPGGLMSLQDREKAAGLIESFYEALEVSH